MNLRPLRPELPAAATMLVAEHGRVAHSLAGWQIAVVVLRYFVAVLMLGEWVRTPGTHIRRRVRRLHSQPAGALPIASDPKSHQRRTQGNSVRRLCGGNGGYGSAVAALSLTSHVADIARRKPCLVPSQWQAACRISLSFLHGLPTTTATPGRQRWSGPENRARKETPT